MSKQATNTVKVITGKWSAPVKLPNGKRGSLLVISEQASKGDRFTATAGSGVVTTGALDTLIKSDDKGNRWTVVRDPKTPAQRAADQAMRATSTAAFWSSEKGIETAAKREARAEREALKVTEVTSATAATIQAGKVPTMVELLTSLIGAGVAPEEAVKQATDTLAALAAIAAAVKPVAAVKVTSKQAPTGKPCDSCSKVAALVRHKSASEVLGHQALVCPTCITGDANVIAAKVIRTSSKAPATK